MILLPVKFFVESEGVALISCGGSESLGPPDGGIILAHPEVLKIAMITVSATRKNAMINFALMQYANIACFYLLPVKPLLIISKMAIRIRFLLLHSIREVKRQDYLFLQNCTNDNLLYHSQYKSYEPGCFPMW